MARKVSWVAFGLVFLVSLIFTVFPTAGVCAATRLTIGWMEGPQAGTNPFLARSHGDTVFQSLIYEPLAISMMDGTVKPWLAKSWEYDEASKTWIFHLDERAKWNDGRPLTAEDVKFTFETAYKYNFVIGANTKALVAAVEARDAHTVAFKMAAPLAAFVSVLGDTPIMPKHIWEKVEKVDQFQNPDPVASGPYKVKEFNPRAYLLLVKNDLYWRQPVKVDEVVIKVFTNTQAEVVALKKGELDIIPDLSGSEALIPTLMRDKKVTVLIERIPHILYIAVNYRKHPLEVKDFRRAIDFSVDKKAIIETALGGYGELPLMGYVPPLVEKWADQSLTWRGLDMTEEQRLKEADALLDKLGYKKGADGMRLDDKGNKLSFTVRCYTNPSYIRACEMIKKNLAQIGIQMEVIVNDPETLYGGIVYSGKRPMDWDMMVHGSTVTPDPDSFARGYAPEPATPWDNAPAFGWENIELQNLLKATRREMNEAKRLEMVKQAQAKFADDLVVITLGHRFGSAAYRNDKFSGWNPVGVAYNRMFNPLGSLINVLSLTPQ
jgi:peptide/nickel transport system substrate-binding protein